MVLHGIADHQQLVVPVACLWSAFDITFFSLQCTVCQGNNRFFVCFVCFVSSAAGIIKTSASGFCWSGLTWSKLPNLVRWSGYSTRIVIFSSFVKPSMGSSSSTTADQPPHLEITSQNCFKEEIGESCFPCHLSRALWKVYERRKIVTNTVTIGTIPNLTRGGKSGLRVWITSSAGCEQLLKVVQPEADRMAQRESPWQCAKASRWEELAIAIDRAKKCQPNMNCTRLREYSALLLTMTKSQEDGNGYLRRHIWMLTLFKTTDQIQPS